MNVEHSGRPHDFLMTWLLAALEIDGTMGAIIRILER